MSTCLNFDDIVALGEPQIAHLQTVGDSFPDSEAPGACIAFSKQVRIVESFLTQTYAVAASIARRSEDLTEVSTVWDRMGKFCTVALHVLTGLKNKYPYCGTPELHDLALDYKLACSKRYHNSLEEIECQKNQLPKGLFPEMI
jgi:hypothetical protein